MSNNKLDPKINKKLLKPKKLNKKIINNEDENFSKGIDIVKNYNDQRTQNENRIMKKDTNTQVYYNEKKITYSKIRPIIISLIIIIIVGLVFAFFEYGPIIGINLNKEISIENTKRIDIVTTDNDIYKKYNNELLIYSNQILSTYNTSGSKTWEYRMQDAFTPNIYICDRYMIVSNNQNGTIYLFDNKTEILNKKIEGSIQNIYLDNKGNFALEYSTSGFKKIISVYSKDGTEKYNTYLNSNSIIDIKLLDKAEKLLVIQANASSFKVGIEINVVDGTKSSDNVKTLAKLDNNFIYDLTIQGQNIIMLLDNKISKLDMNTGAITDIKAFDSNQLLYMALSDNYYTFVEKELNVEQYAIKTARFDNSIIGTLNVDNSPKSLENSGFLNYFLYQDKLSVVNKWAIDVKNVKIDFPPKNIIVFDNEKSAALIYTNKIYVVNM